MVIDGKPVRLILQGDRIEAAKWIPYFAGLCRTMAHAHEKQTASREGMRGWAKNLGGQAFEIYVKVEGGLRYYDVSGYWMWNTPATHHVDFQAWKIPDAKLEMSRVSFDPVTGEETRGTSVRIGPFKVMNGYYSEYNNSVVRIGKDLFTCYAGESADVFGVLLFKSKDVAKDQKAEDVSVLLEIGDLPSTRSGPKTCCFCATRRSTASRRTFRSVVGYDLLACSTRLPTVRQSATSRRTGPPTFWLITTRCARATGGWRR